MDVVKKNFPFCWRKSFHFLGTVQCCCIFGPLWMSLSGPVPPFWAWRCSPWWLLFPCCSCSTSLPLKVCVASAITRLLELWRRTGIIFSGGATAAVWGLQWGRAQFYQTAISNWNDLSFSCIISSTEAALMNKCWTMLVFPTPLVTKNARCRSLLSLNGSSFSHTYAARTMMKSGRW